MTTDLQDSAVGRGMQMARAMQWFAGTQGDPYGLVLRAQDDDPYPLYEKIRARGPIYPSGLGTWVTADHGVGARILRDARFGMRTADGQPAGQHILCPEGSFLTLEPAAYDRLRRLVEPVIGEVADDCREGALRAAREILGQASGEFDLVTDLAARVPGAMFADLFELTGSQRERLDHHLSRLGATLDGLLCPQRLNTVRDLGGAAAGLAELFTESLAAPGAARANGLAGRLLRQANDQGLGTADVLTACLLLTVVTAETTGTLLANAVSALLADQDAWAALRDGQDGVGRAIAEAVRHDPPVQLQSRVAHADVEVAGQHLPSGADVVVVVGGANRDPGVYPDPDRFDPSRPSGPDPLTFAGGFPLGPAAPLVTLTAEAMLSAVAIDRPGLRPAGALLRRRRSPVVRGVLSMPVIA